MTLTTLLLCIVNRVGDKMLPSGTPFSCNFSEVQVLSDLSSNRGEDMNVFILSGGVIGLFWIKTYSHHVLMFYKTLMDMYI